jgi:hypothetical protein
MSATVSRRGFLGAALAAGVSPAAACSAFPGPKRLITAEARAAVAA